MNNNKIIQLKSHKNELKVQEKSGFNHQRQVLVKTAVIFPDKEKT
jgi:hypothetical protein